MSVLLGTPLEDIAIDRVEFPIATGLDGECIDATFSSDTPRYLILELLKHGDSCRFPGGGASQPLKTLAENIESLMGNMPSSVMLQRLDESYIDQDGRSLRDNSIIQAQWSFVTLHPPILKKNRPRSLKTLAYSDREDADTLYELPKEDEKQRPLH